MTEIPDEMPQDLTPAAAWSLIQNLRAEKAEIKTERDAFRTSAQEREDAEKTELQRALDRITQTETRASAAERDLWVERALRKHPLPEGLTDEEETELVSFLTGDTEEAILSKAARLATLGRAAGVVPPPTPGDAEVLRSKLPTLALVPGHSDVSADPEPSAAAVARSILDSR